MTTKLDVIRILKRLGLHGAHFQFRDVREALGIATEDKAASASVFNNFSALADEGLIEEVPGNRKRNKYYRIKDEDV